MGQTLASLLIQERWEPLTCTNSDLESWLVSWKVAVHALVGVTDVPLIAWLSDLPGTALAAATPVQDGAHPRGTEWSFPALAGPLAELPPLSSSPPISGSQLCIVLSPAEPLGEEEEDRDLFWGSSPPLMLWMLFGKLLNVLKVPFWTPHRRLQPDHDWQ